MTYQDAYNWYLEDLDDAVDDVEEILEYEGSIAGWELREIASFYNVALDNILWEVGLLK